MVWLQDLWEKVEGRRPPLSAAVMLADDHRAWRPRQQALWTRLRVATLHAVWHCRSWRHELVGSFAAAAVARIVEHVRAAIQRDWMRVTEDVRLLSDLPADYFRGRNPRLEHEDFVASWAHRSVLCSINQGNLVVHISLQSPVAVPVQHS